jgi:L-rhamnose mutarotase
MTLKMPRYEKGKLMKSFGMALNLKDDARAIEAYKLHHRNVWPEVETALKSVGITSMKIFLIGRKLFMVLETVDDFKPARDFPRYLEKHARCAEWDDLMRTYQEKIPEAGDREWWALMEQVYDLR